MKNKFVKGVSLACILSLIISCNPKKEEAAEAVVDKEQVKKEIQEKENEFAAAYNNGSKENIGYFADDAVTFPQNNAPVAGKPAIVKYYFSAIDSNTASHKIAFLTREVFPSNDGKQVIEVGYFKVTDSTNTEINTGNYMVLFEKRNGKYVCVREISASDMPNQ